ncbi:MAG: tetratricopeptide repeat protein [Deltaproteobacteria bacterium]|nr:tetratricopeptide repeat protein [Deltaproteobacteria bacterium]
MVNGQENNSSRGAKSWTRFIPLIILVLAPVIVFWPVFGHQFLRYDDSVVVYKNPFLQQPSFDNFIHFWRYPYEGLYTPITYTVIALAAWAPMLLSGTATAAIPPDPRVFHGLNLFLHLLCVLSVWQIIRLLLRRTNQKDTPQSDNGAALPIEWAACGGALLFAIHPIQIEPVAWAAGLKDVLFGLLSLTAVWFYLLSVEAQSASRRRGCYWLATGVFILALLAKPTAVVVPVIAWLLAAWGWQRNWRDQISSLLLWFMIALAWGLLTRWVQPGTVLDFKPSFWTRPLIAGDAVAFYLYQLVWPLGFGPDYGRTPQYVSQHAWLYITGLVPWIVAAWIWLKRKNLPWLAATAGVFVVGLLPVLGLISFSFQRFSTVADRYVYLAMLGPAIALAWSLMRPQKYIATAGGAFVLGIFLLFSIFQLPHWQNNEAFFKHALEINSDSSFSHNNLGLVYADSGRPQEAIQHYNEALRIEPEFAVAHLNLADALVDQGQYREAMQHYDEAIRIVPNYARAYTNKGSALARQKRYTEAIEAHRMALKLEPGFAEAYNNLGNTLMRQRRIQEAEQNFNQALKLNPSLARAHINLGIVLAMQKRFEEAIGHFSEALRLQPTSAKAHYNLAGVLLQQGNLKEAQHHYTEALRLNPDYLNAHLRLSIVLANQGNFSGAIYHASEALRINPRHKTARQLLERLQSAQKSSGSTE